MNRRAFFRRASLIAAGVVAADQLEILERLTWRRRYFPGADLANWYEGSGGWDVRWNGDALYGGWFIYNASGQLLASGQLPATAYVPV